MKTEKADKALRIIKLLNAPIDLVWEVWTEPGHIKNWWGPNGFTNTIHKMDFKVGGEWLLTMHGPDGKNYPNKIIFKEIIPFKKIAFQHFNPDFITTVDFVPQGDVTYMYWNMEFESKEMLEIVIKTFKADEGLEQNIIKLKNYLLQRIE